MCKFPTPPDGIVIRLVFRTYGEATTHVGQGHEAKSYMSRWEGGSDSSLTILNNVTEAENRLHIMIDILAFIHAKNIEISFMNNTDVCSPKLSPFPPSCSLGQIKPDSCREDSPTIPIGISFAHLRNISSPSVGWNPNLPDSPQWF